MMLNLNPQDFVKLLKQQGIKRFYFVYDVNKCIYVTSHPFLQPICDFLNNDKRDSNKHEALFLNITDKYDTLQGIFVHKTKRGQAQGGTRYWRYNKVEDYFRDGLRLSMGMTHKNALAGLYWGGGKAVLNVNPDIDSKNADVRKYLFNEFGSFVTSVRGCYVTAEDVGTNIVDMSSIFEKTRFITCIPQEFGGSGNPSEATARGVVSGMEAALDFLNLGSVEGKTVVVQGMGNVGGFLIEKLFEKNVGKVIASDINSELIEKTKERFAGKNFEAVKTEIGDNSILAYECDVLAPCATGAILNSVMIPAIKAKIVCGAANNQLEDPIRHDKMLYEKGIYYLPDFLINRMGIVNCANEQYGYVNGDWFFERHLGRQWEQSVYNTSLKVLKTSKQESISPGIVAVNLANELSEIEHPIFGHRGKQIIDSVVGNWK